MRVLEEVASTQDLAREAAAEGVPAVVIAHRQTAGRGRTGSAWETAPRSVSVSVAFRSERQAPHSLTAGVAARRVLGEAVSLKWPNDILVGDDKAGGILVEVFDDLVVAGLGLNLYWPAPPPGVAGLRVQDPGPEAGPPLAEAWAGALLGLVAGEWPRDEYLAACSTLGRDVVWEPGGRGRVVDVDAAGALVVLTDAGERRLDSGAVRHVRKI